MKLEIKPDGTMSFAEGYVEEKDAEAFLASHLGVPAPSSPRVNVVIHVSSPLPPVSPLLIAADLADYRADREDSSHSLLYRLHLNAQPNADLKLPWSGRLVGRWN